MPRIFEAAISSRMGPARDLALGLSEGLQKPGRESVQRFTSVVNRALHAVPTDPPPVVNAVTRPGRSAGVGNSRFRPGLDRKKTRRPQGEPAQRHREGHDRPDHDLDPLSDVIDIESRQSDFDLSDAALTDPAAGDLRPDAG